MNDVPPLPAEPALGAVPLERSSRAPEGTARRDDPGYDRSSADGAGQPLERSPREPAEGKPQPVR